MLLRDVCAAASKGDFAVALMVDRAHSPHLLQTALVASLRSYAVQGVHEQFVATAGHATGKAQQSGVRSIAEVCKIRTICGVGAAQKGRSRAKMHLPFSGQRSSPVIPISDPLRGVFAQKFFQTNWKICAIVIHGLCGPFLETGVTAGEVDVHLCFVALIAEEDFWICKDVFRHGNFDHWRLPVVLAADGPRRFANGLLGVRIEGHNKGAVPSTHLVLHREHGAGQRLQQGREGNH
mmetsp:Transcript_46593/g.74147  ORF Transcript_46593/g.74147 Transcript_46593/m.74147 type:complete len:236 (+) Transcript_46593:582-1289(+)